MKKPLLPEDIMTIPQAALKARRSAKQIRTLKEKGLISSGRIGNYEVVSFTEIKDYYNKKYSL